MTVYIVMTVLSFLCACAAEKIKNESIHMRGYRLFCFLSFLPLALVSAFRYKTGTDWQIYATFFDTINSGGERFREPGFNLLNEIVYLFSRDVSILVTVTAFITYFFVFRGIYKWSKSAQFSILIYIIGADYFNSFNQLRQALAAAVFLYAIGYIWERKPVKYILFILLAASFHFGALVFLPLYFLYGIKVRLKAHVPALLLGALTLPLAGKLFVYIVSNTRYGWYLGSVYDTGNFYVIGFTFTVALLLLYYFYYLYGEDRNDKCYWLIINTGLISALLLLYTAYIPQILRLSSMLGTIHCIGLPMLALRERNYKRRFVLCLGLVLMFVAKLLYDVYVNGWYGVVPYQSVFSS